MMQTEKFQRKTFTVDAVQVTEENMEEVAKWCGGDIRTEVTRTGESRYIKVRVYRPADESQTRAYVGRWVLYAGTGYKVYNPGAFEKAFEAVFREIEIPEPRQSGEVIDGNG